MKRKRILWMVLLLLFFQIGIVAAADPDERANQEIRELLRRWGYPNVAFYYENLETGTNLYYNHHKGYFPCSTVKMKGILNLYDKARAGEIDLNKVLTYTREYYRGGSAHIIYRGLNKKYTLRQLAEYSIHYSDNAAYLMTQRFLGRNLLRSIVGPEERVWTPYQTAQELKRLYRFMQVDDPYSKELLQYFTKTRFENSIPSGVPSHYVVAHKTGDQFVPLMDHDSAIVFAPSPYILTVYTVGMPSFPKAAQFTRELTKIIEERNSKIPASVDPAVTALSQRAKQEGYLPADTRDYVIREKKISTAEFVKMAVQAVDKTENPNGGVGSVEGREDSYYLTKAKDMHMIFSDELPLDQPVSRELASVILSKAYFKMMDVKKSRNLELLKAKEPQNVGLADRYIASLDADRQQRRERYQAFDSGKEFSDSANIAPMYHRFVKEAEVYGFLPKAESGNFLPKQVLTVEDALHLIFALREITDQHGAIPAVAEMPEKDEKIAESAEKAAEMMRDGNSAEETAEKAKETLPAVETGAQPKGLPEEAIVPASESGAEEATSLTTE